MNLSRRELDDKVLQFLRASHEPMNLRQIERKLEDGQVEADTFDVRDAIWRLIAEHLAEFTPRRCIHAVRQAAGDGG